MLNLQALKTCIFSGQTFPKITFHREEQHLIQPVDNPVTVNQDVGYFFYFYQRYLHH
jgi:hypothetical protein